MYKKRDITELRKEFWELYKLLTEQYVLKNDIISIGNLALFVDQSYDKNKWLDKKCKIKELAYPRERNELNMYMANYLYEIALDLRISDNVPYKLNKLTKAYQEKKLHYFDIVLDPYEFPDWFKKVMDYFPLSDKKQLHIRLLERLKKYPSFQEKGNQVGLSYFVDKYLTGDGAFEVLAELEDMIQEKTLNQLSWFLAMQIFSFYYPDMQRRNKKEEQVFALSKLKEYKILYERNQLETFDLFTPSMRDTLLAEFTRGT